VRAEPPLSRGLEAVIGFTGHCIVATALSEAAVHAQGVDAFGGCFEPSFLCWLAGPLGWLDSIDVTLVARGSGGGRLPRRTDLDDHPRVQRARVLRTDVEVYGDERGLVTLAIGLAGRRELSIEVPAESQGRGIGRSLLRDALGLISTGEPVFAAVAPGNARSLRAFLSLGFTPLGSELLLSPGRASPPAHKPADAE
jgi:GNAT superfamily N-acetyltransferase